MNARKYASWFGALVTAGLCLAVLTRSAAAQEVKQSLNLVSLEVMALQALEVLELRPAQLRGLPRLAAVTADKSDRKREPAKVTKEYREILIKLRDALVKGDNDEADKLDNKLQEAAEKQDPVLDTDFDITEAARDKVAEFLPLLSPTQVAAILSTIPTPDPVETLTDALEAGHELKGDEWNETRNEAAEEASKMLVGLSETRVKKTALVLSKLLDELHGMPDAKLPAQRARLESEVRTLAGKLGPIRILQHSVEYYLAELLSNPRLANVIDASRKAAKK